MGVQAIVVLFAATGWSNSGWQERFEGALGSDQLAELMDLDRFKEEVKRYDLEHIRGSNYFDSSIPQRIIIVSDSDAQDVAVMIHNELWGTPVQVRRLYRDDPCLALFAGQDPIRGELSVCESQVAAFRTRLLLPAATKVIFASCWLPDTLTGLSEAIVEAANLNPSVPCT